VRPLVRCHVDFERGSVPVDHLTQTEDAIAEARFMTAIPARLQWDEWVPFPLPEGHSRFEYLRYQSITR